MKKPPPVQIAQIHNHINVYAGRRGASKDPTGPVTTAEKIEAITNHIAYHERQARIGRQLLDLLGRDVSGGCEPQAGAEKEVAHGVAG
jgi:hypothetical protein